MKSFAGANVECMSHYIKPATDEKPEQVILHCGTNNLAKYKTEKIVSDIKSSVNNVHENILSVTISAIVPRRGSLKKAYEVNEKLNELCSENNFCFVLYNNINPNIHKNRGGLHLNKTGLG